MSDRNEWIRQKSMPPVREWVATGFPDPWDRQINRSLKCRREGLIKKINCQIKLLLSVWLRLGWWSFMVLWAVCWLASVHGIATVGPVPKSHYLRGGFMTKLCPNMIFCVSLRSICSSVPSCPANHTYCAYILICHHRCYRYSQWKCSRATTLCRLICTVSELFIPKPHKHIQLLVHSV